MTESSPRSQWLHEALAAPCLPAHTILLACLKEHTTDLRKCFPELTTLGKCVRTVHQTAKDS